MTIIITTADINIISAVVIIIVVIIIEQRRLYKIFTAGLSAKNKLYNA